MGIYMYNELINTIAFSLCGFIKPIELLEIYEKAVSESIVAETQNNFIEYIHKSAPKIFIEKFSYINNAIEVAKQNIEYCYKHGIQIMRYGDEKYPYRLKECCDAPLVLYYKGNADLNTKHAINIIGTRNCSSYGQDLVHSFVKELKQICPNTIIFSGLAYGIDVCAHREALKNNFNTIGILAHGLDMIYPRVHYGTAIKMIEQGGLLTEFPIKTQPRAKNFIQRNRIIAGCSDATILVESANKGGGIITCNLANSYSRDVFAFPGAVGQEYSEGCNKLIRQNAAALITSAADFVKSMEWDDELKLKLAREKGIEMDLFPNLSEDERNIINTLKKTNDLQINMLSINTKIPIKNISSLLFELEMKGIIRTMAGGIYHLIS